MSKADEKIVHLIKKDDELEFWLEQTMPNSKDVLLIIDLFKTWSGRCESLFPSFRNLQQKYADRLVFLSLEIPKFAQIVQGLECGIMDCVEEGKNVAETKLHNLPTRGCSPLFLAIRYDYFGRTLY